MTLKTVDDVIRVAESRGLRIWIDPGPPPMPMLRVPSGVDRGLATVALMDALKAWRVDIIERLTKESA